MENTILNNKIYNELIEQLSEEKIKKAEKIVKENDVNIVKTYMDDIDNFEIRAIVNDDNKYNTYIKVSEDEIENLSCTCEEYKENYCACLHIIATMKKFIENYNKKMQIENINNVISYSPEDAKTYKIFNQLIKTFKYIIDDDVEQKNAVEQKENLKIEPKIIYNKFNNTIKIEIKIGQAQLYKVKSLPEFYERFLKKENYKYGSKLEFVHTKEAFAPEYRDLLDYILKYSEIIKYANEASNGYEYYTKRLGEDCILISNTGIDELFKVLENKMVTMEDENCLTSVEFVPKEPDIQFFLNRKNEKEFAITTNASEYDYKVFEGKEYSYILLDKKLYKCSKKYDKTVLQMLELYRKNFVKEIVLPKKELSNFFATVEPYIKKSINISDEQYQNIKKYIPAELDAKMYLDYDENNYIIADIRFIYGDIQINPLDIQQDVNIPRNSVKEAKLIDMLLKSGFMYDQKNSRLVLIDEEKIYNFLSNDIEMYMKNFEVLATDNFKEKQIKREQKVSVGVKIENNLLDIDLSNLNFDARELQEIMRKYRLKRKFHRLKDGSFINLENNSNIEFIQNITKDIDIDYSKIKDNNIKMPVYRSFYLEKVLEKSKFISANRDENYKKFVNGLTKTKAELDKTMSKHLNASLREYQIIGFNWLKTLDEYGVGGILADDMGLGKTVQILSVIATYIDEAKVPKPTLVVCPSSLTLNWQSEINKFTNGISSIVVHGTLEERQKQIKDMPKYNIIITSYELLKRDIQEYQKYNYDFKYIVADEAQYIKNNNTKNAKAIKEIKAETRYALTGTPIENSLSELWSIFDFIMPGYLFSYKKFKELYETPIIKENEKETMEKLKKLINPFVLRRIKKEVLTELPDKTVTVLNSQMTEEQRDIYMAYLVKAKKNVAEEIKENGIEKSQIKILALLTRLRQICCHPSLFIDNYKGTSGKLNQCLEILKDAINSNHKILLFSGYTSMLEIIEKMLKEENIKYLKLTGQTKVGDRMNLVDEFNQNEEIKVFLISLKAGGTGLNLTSADMVIHYDPWWNLSAENQATDRTYRIGQKRNVQVYKLITKDSIEEKIYELQKRKETLIDTMLSTNQTFISKLSKEEILSLFE